MWQTLSMADYDVPKYVGEFSFFDNEEIWIKYLNQFDKMGFGWTFWSYKTISVGWWDSSWGLYVQKLHLYNRDENGELIVTTNPDEYVLKLDVRTASYEELYALWSQEQTEGKYYPEGMYSYIEKYFEQKK